jgi:rSAM-associated Gly-rich repeat protein
VLRADPADGTASRRSMMMEEALALRQKYRETVSKLMTPGAIGMAVLLGSAAPVAASQPPLPAPGQSVSERLAAIREAVSAVADAQKSPTDPVGERRLAWGNWGFGFGVPWGNFGYGAPWSNWNNWRNGWHNWGNRWGNW